MLRLESGGLLESSYTREETHTEAEEMDLPKTWAQVSSTPQRFSGFMSIFLEVEGLVFLPCFDRWPRKGSTFC